MCLWAVAHRVHGRYPLIFAGNRDELHRRPARAAHWWDGTTVLAGRDLEAGGTWLGVSAAGRFAVVTNFREIDPPGGPRPSRGELVLGWLGAEGDARGYLQALQASGARYAGFNLLFGEPGELHYLSNRGYQASPLPHGVHVLANGPLDSQAPKVARLQDGLRAVLAQHQIDPARLLELLADSRPARGDGLPPSGLDAELERRISAPFVLHPTYGTRCSTVVLVDAVRRLQFVERRFDPQGLRTGESSFEFVIGARGA